MKGYYVICSRVHTLLTVMTWICIWHYVMSIQISISSWKSVNGLNKATYFLQIQFQIYSRMPYCPERYICSRFDWMRKKGFIFEAIDGRWFLAPNRWRRQLTMWLSLAVFRVERIPRIINQSFFRKIVCLTIINLKIEENCFAFLCTESRWARENW